MVAVKRKKSIVREWTEAILIAFIAVVLLRNFVFALYYVPTGSAEPTLLVGDRVWGNNMAYLFGGKPQYGDLVMFSDQKFKYSTNPLQYLWQRYVGFGLPILGLPSGPDNIVKRLIGKPGDTVEGKIEDGKPVVYRNGEKLDEPYINPYPLIALRKKIGFIDRKYLGPLAVPEFLQTQSKPVFYTYNPTKSYDEQPFYKMSSDEVYHPIAKDSGSFLSALTQQEIKKLKTDYSEMYYLQTILSGRGKVDIDPKTGEKRLLQFSGDPETDFKGRSVDEFGPIKLGPNQYWVMGDSRRNSGDSRFTGTLDGKNIFGRASFIIFSIDSEEAFWLFELIKHPIDFWRKSVRWSRFLKGISNDNRIPQTFKPQETAVV